MNELEETEYQIEKKGISRRDFLKFCGMVAATLGLEASFIPKIAHALDGRPPVVWLQFAECTGCTESFLRSANPYIDQLILNILSVEYHETLMAGAGHIGTPGNRGITDNLYNTINQYNGQFICIVEVSIPTKDNGVYGMIGGKTMLQIAKEVCSKAKCVICYGTCSSFGGLAAAAPNPTGAKSVHQALSGFPTINVPGCPPNPFNLVSTVADYLLKAPNYSYPSLDQWGRPIFAYGTKVQNGHGTVHEQCPRQQYGLKYPCLFEQGCRGRITNNNCPTQKFNEGTSWPVLVDAPCYGCSTPGFWDNAAGFFDYSKLR